MICIAVSGSAGSGKSTYAKRLAKKKKYYYFDLSTFIKEQKLYDSYDRSLKTYIVDPKTLFVSVKKFLQTLDHKGMIIDGHLSHYFPKTFLKEVIVVLCDVKTLRKRLEKRKYSKKKIEENIQAEIMETCLIEAEEAGHKVKLVEGKGLNKTLRRKKL